MNDFPFSRILDFLHTVTPFDTLRHEELAQLASKMEIAYYPRNEVIMRRGDKLPDHIHIIQVGSVRITISDESGGEILVDLREKGDVFGALTLLRAKESLFDITADEDLITFVLPVEAFHELVDRHPEFKQYFSFSLAGNIMAARRSSNCPLPRLFPLNTVNLDMFLIGKSVTDLMVTKVLTCSRNTSIRKAVQLMTQRRAGSIVIENQGGTPCGIVTDRDLRQKVLAQGYSLDGDVETVMSRPLHTIDPGAYAFDALLAMSRHGVRHLVAIEHDRVAGIISEHDFRMETGSSPVGVIGDIEKSQSVDELVGLHFKIDRVMEVLLRQGGSIKTLTQLITELNDRVTLQLIELTEREIKNQGLGSPPVPYCWVALGSEGRREQTLRTDQDNALLFENVPPEEEESVKQWFLRFSEKVVDGLARYGFPRCRGGVMASNPQWCRSETQWEKIFLEWVMRPEPLGLRMAGIFFDFRALYSGKNSLEILRQRLNETITNHRRFLGLMAKSGLHNRPPLGFLRQFVVEKTGEHKNELDLKLRGLVPMVDSARVMALDIGANPTSTVERLTEIGARKVLTEELLADLFEAYDFINYLRITTHLEARARGEEPDNFIDPVTLNSLQRKMLKESFKVINRLQEVVAVRYQTQFIVDS